MGERRSAWRGGSRGLGAVVVAAGVGLAATANAVGARGPGSRQVLTVDAHHWDVRVDGRTETVKPGGALRYCASARVESINPVVKLHANRSNEHHYSFRLVGPKALGRTFDSERDFRGHSTVLRAPTPPAAFLGVPARSVAGGVTGVRTITRFLPGTYTLYIYYHRLPLVLTRYQYRTVLVQTLRLARRAGC